MRQKYKGGTAQTCAHTLALLWCEYVLTWGGWSVGRSGVCSCVTTVLVCLLFCFYLFVFVYIFVYFFVFIYFFKKTRGGGWLCPPSLLLIFLINKQGCYPTPLLLFLITLIGSVHMEKEQCTLDCMWPLIWLVL